MTDRNGRETGYSYDDIDRLISENWIGNPQEILYSYDKASNLTQIGDLFSTLSFSYDARDRVTQVSNAGTPGAPEVVLDYAYDAAGNRTAMTETIEGVAGAVTNYAYDALNRMVQIGQGGTGVSEKRADFGYNALGQFASISRFADLAGNNGVTDTRYSYDALNRVTGINHENGAGNFAFYNFDYDPGSRITAITDAAGRSEYSYDATDQLTGADHGNPLLADEGYDYDLNGNRITTETQGTDYVTGPGNRLLEDSRYTYTYDAEGNMTSRTDKATGELRIFEWDYRNRLIGVTDEASDGMPLQQVEYTYDAFDRRIAKLVDGAPGDTVEGDTTHFVYDGDDVVLEFDRLAGGDVDLARRNLHGPAVDQILAVERVGEGETRWLHTDHLGTVKTVTDEAGTVVNEITYDSFGNVEAQTDDNEAVRYGFTGREFDEETGQYFYRARYYNSSIGEFISDDPINFNGRDQNLSRYVHNDVLNFKDPTGEFKFCKRPLSWAPFMTPSGTLADDYALQFAHEHGFYEDGSGDNIGYGPGGPFSEPLLDIYVCEQRSYDDSRMRRAQERVVQNTRFGNDNYGFLRNNCQDFSDDLREEYENILQEEKKKHDL